METVNVQVPYRTLQLLEGLAGRNAESAEDFAARLLEVEAKRARGGACAKVRFNVTRAVHEEIVYLSQQEGLTIGQWIDRTLSRSLSAWYPFQVLLESQERLYVYRNEFVFRDKLMDSLEDALQWMLTQGLPENMRVWLGGADQIGCAITIDTRNRLREQPSMHIGFKQKDFLIEGVFGEVCLARERYAWDEEEPSPLARRAFEEEFLKPELRPEAVLGSFPRPWRPWGRQGFAYSW